MNFKAIQDAVLADAFAEAKRASAIQWINHRYTWLCDLEEWTFMRASQDVTVTSGSSIVTNLPADFQAARILFDQYGGPLDAIREPDEFYRKYLNPSSPPVGQPEAFTVDGGVLLVGPVPNVTSTVFKLVYDRMATLLVADGDVPILPAGYHMGLVHGGKAEGFRLTNVPLADQFDVDFRGTIDAMRAKYLVSVRDKQRQSPAYRADNYGYSY